MGEEREREKDPNPDESAACEEAGFLEEQSQQRVRWGGPPLWKPAARLLESTVMAIAGSWPDSLPF